jgi:hypothetical protein
LSALHSVQPAEVQELVATTDQAIARLRLAFSSTAPAKTARRTPASRHANRQLRQRILEAHSQSTKLETFLVASGLAPQTLAVFKAWFKLNNVVEAAQTHNLAGVPVADGVPVSAGTDAAYVDPFKPLTADQLGQRLSIVAATVRVREGDRELFSVLPPGRTRGRLYPAFQALPEVAGAPMRETLAALGPSDTSAPSMFFSSSSPELHGLTPLEVLIGRLTRDRDIEPEARQLLRAQAATRRRVVVAAAQAFAADRAA